MIYGAIIDKGERFYTYMGKIFHAIENAQTEYNWLITDCDCFPNSPDVGDLFAQKYCFLSGHELTSIVNQDDFQWVWAVLSGFKRDIPLEDILKHPLPYADGCEDFWKNPLSIQHPLAEVEIVPWDSSLTMIFSQRKDIVDSFRKYFPLSEDMASFNERLASN